MLTITKYERGRFRTAAKTRLRRHYAEERAGHGG